MDLAQISSVLPTAGGAGILLIIITILFRLLTRANAREAELREAWAKDRERVEAAHDAEKAELRGRIDELDRRVDDLNKRLDEERDLRRKAQDDAAEAIRLAVAHDET